jgi:cell fate regulator YaaT (PSP1 superfamily)
MSEDDNKIVGVRFTNVGKIYHFDASNVKDIQIGDAVIVQTSRGWQMGFVADLIESTDSNDKMHLKKIDRKATPRDLMIRQTWQH